MFKVCVNGARLPSEHPRLPVTPVEIALDAAAVWAEGAQAVHVHVKDSRGRDTFAAESLAATLEEIRTAVPALPVGVTTGAWALPDPVERVRAIRGWTSVPDFASVNWHEDGADDVAAALLERGVGVEAGLWHEQAVEAWSDSPFRDRCLRVLIELPDGLDPNQTVAVADELLAEVRSATSKADRACDAVPVLLHGEGSSTWPAFRHAVALGLSTRIGLEDTLIGPEGQPVSDNAELVRHAGAIIRRAKQRDPAPRSASDAERRTG